MKMKESQKKNLKKNETPKNEGRKMARSKSRRRLSRASDVSVASSVKSGNKTAEDVAEESPRASRFAIRQIRKQENEKRKREREGEEGKMTAETDKKKEDKKKTPPSMKTTTEENSRYIHSLKKIKNKNFNLDQKASLMLLNDLKQKILRKRMTKNGNINEVEYIKEAIKLCFRLENEQIEFYNTTEGQSKILYIFTLKGSIELKINKNQNFTIKTIFSLLISAVNNHKYPLPGATYLDKGTYIIQNVRPDVFPVIRRQNCIVHPKYYTKKMISNISNYISDHESYFQPLNITLGLYYLKDYADNLRGYANSYSYKVGETFKSEDIQEEDDLYLAGRPDLAEMMKLMNLNSLPANRNEHFIMKKQKKRCKELGNFLLENKFKIAKTYSFKEQI